MALSIWFASFSKLIKNGIAINEVNICVGLQATASASDKQPTNNFIFLDLVLEFIPRIKYIPIIAKNNPDIVITS